MATKKRSSRKPARKARRSSRLSGSPAEHADEFRRLDQKARTRISQAHDAMNNGDCGLAFSYFTNAASYVGQAHAHSGSMETNRQAPKLQRDMDELDDAFGQACVMSKPKKGR